MIPYLVPSKTVGHVKKYIIRDKMTRQYPQLQLTLNGTWFNDLFTSTTSQSFNLVLSPYLEALKLGSIKFTHSGFYGIVKMSLRSFSCGAGAGRRWRRKQNGVSWKRVLLLNYLWIRGTAW